MAGVTQDEPRPVRRSLRRFVLGVFLVGLLVVGGTSFRVWQVARGDDRTPADVVLVLGAAQYAGTPSKVLEARLRHAKELYDEGVAPYIVTTGGNQPGDTYTEATAGVRWLTGQGVPEDHVIAVGEGNDTLGSIEAAAEKIHEHGWKSVVIVSDPWHSLRARTMASDAGLDAWTSPTHSGPIVQTRETQIRYILYETAALLYYRATNAPAENFGVPGNVGADK
ncbi:YdcF family protein [Actinophytocola algeriensis]|jgi:vancomycin permeability regulator SanA|uniref:YdcF family protein n=1 Tax=Actinophytocola algeriensis TaxID=1768010 RepID=UPI00161EC353